MEKLDAAYEGPAGLARLNQILQMAALTAGEPAQQVRNEDRIPIITIHQAKGASLTMYSYSRPQRRYLPKPVLPLQKGVKMKKSACSMWP